MEIKSERMKSRMNENIIEMITEWSIYRTSDTKIYHSIPRVGQVKLRERETSDFPSPKPLRLFNG